MQLDEERRLKEMQELQAAVDIEQNRPPTQPIPQPTAPVQQSPAPQQTNSQPQQKQDGGLDLGKAARYYYEGAASIPMGIVDWGIDLINMPIPDQYDIKKAPKFENDVFQAVREISSVISPTLLLSKAAGGKIKSFADKSKAKFLTDPAVKWFGNAALNAGIGAGVDFVAEQNEQDDNLSGSLKKMFPRAFGWIPDNIATLDSDSPELKRLKNVTEGAGLGFGTDLFEGAFKLFRALRGVDDAVKFIPESEKAKNWFANNVDVAPTTPEEAVTFSAAKRVDALDGLGSYNLNKSVNLDEPQLGVHDMFSYRESGIRSRDNLGIVGASIDQARIDLNLETSYGRVGSVITDPAIKFGLDTEGGQEVIIRGLAQDLKDSGEYGWKSAPGNYLSHKQIVESGEKLASEFYKLDLPSLKKTIESLQQPDIDTKIPQLSSPAYVGVMKTIKRYMSDFMDMDYMRAQSYLATSLGGQVSDMSQGMRLMSETEVVERAQDQIIDRLEFLMAQKGMTSYVRGRALNMLNFWKRLTSSSSDRMTAKYAKEIGDSITDDADGTLQAMEKIRVRVRETMNTMRDLRKSNPRLLEPLMLAYEMTDGNINTISRLNNYFSQSTGVFKKAFVDQQPEIPSVVMRGFWSNVYNSVLSAFSTPIKAGLSNVVLLAEKPITTAIGALSAGDTKTLRRGWYQYTAGLETLSNAFSYFGQVFKRSGTDPYVLSAREDLGLRNEKQIELLNKFADAKAKEGEYGPQAMMAIVEEVNALADHPWLRFGTRAMQAFDGFTQSVLANIEARGRAWDQITKNGTVALNSEKADELAKNVYRQMFDENDLIKDEAVQYAAGEVAMNLDSSFNDELSRLINRLPMLKPFLLFTKTPINMFSYMGSHMPNPLKAFVRDVNDFSLEFADMSQDEVAQLLLSRKIPIDPETIEQSYNTLRAEMRGRKALGVLSVMGASGLFMSDRITGNGHYDLQKQKARRDFDWKPRSIRLPGGNWVSYDNLGAISDWVALTVDIMDNFDSLRPLAIQENLRAMGFIIGATFTDRSMLAGLEPLMDVLRGDVGAINQWTSSFLPSAVVPGSSQLAEISRLMSPQLKVVENNLASLIANRNPLTKGSLPDQYDWIDGGKVGEPINFFARVANTYLPWKINGKISPEKQFLIDIEYDARPTLRTNGRGVEFTASERSEVANIMGQDQIFKKEIQRIMQTTDAKEFRSRYMDARSRNLQPDLKTIDNLHRMLDSALRRSQRFAIARMSSRENVTNKQFVNDVVDKFLQRGELDAATKFLESQQLKFR